VFEEGGSGDALPTIELDAAVLARGLPAFELFVRAGSRPRTARRAASSRAAAARINDRPVEASSSRGGPGDRNAEGVNQALGRTQAPRAGAPA